MKGVREMNDILTVGLAKGIKSAIVKEASDNIDAGEYTINELIRVQGTVRKGEDSEQIVHMTVPHWKLIAVLFSKVNGVTMDSVVKEMLELDDDKATVIKQKAKDALDKVKGPAKQTTAGKVTTKLEFSVVKSEQEKEQGVEVPATV
jgi:hypothetical protein